MWKRTVVLGLAIWGTSLVLVPCGSRAAEDSTETLTDQLFLAAREGHVAELTRLVAAGADVGATRKWGQTPLLEAAINGQLAAVEYLAGVGADLDAAEWFHHGTPVGWALGQGHTAVALRLLELGADAREEALAFAVEKGDVALVRAVLDTGPIYQTALNEALRSAAGEDQETKVRQALSAARSRPDLPPPTPGAEELARYAGVYEAEEDRRLEVSVREAGLSVRWGDRDFRLRPVAERRFAAAGKAPTELELEFYGRADMVEGVRLREAGGETARLRPAEAEPIDAPALARLKAKLEEAEVGVEVASTVHWPRFRGPQGRGIGDGTTPPLAWDLESGEGVLWQRSLPGLGNSSPVVWGDRVYVTTAVADGIEQEVTTGLTGSGEGVDEQVPHSWRVLAFDKWSGEPLWSTEVGRGVPKTRRHFKATQANSTPATDGRHVVVVFPTAGLACLGIDGAIHWQHDLGGLNAGAFNSPGIEWGFASSPILHDGRVILQVDIHDGPYLAAWDLESGEELWRTRRSVAPSWSTPVVAAGPDGDELIVNGSTIYGYDPATGEELWSLAPNSELVIAAPIAANQTAYVTAGYPPARPIYALALGQRGQIDPEGGTAMRWFHERGGAYMPSPLLYGGLLTIVHHNGRIATYDATSGDLVYRSRFSKGGTFTGSPVAADRQIYAGTEEGRLYVLRAGPEYEELAVHDVGAPLMATPAISEGVLFLRTPGRLMALGRQSENR